VSLAWAISLALEQKAFWNGYYVPDKCYRSDTMCCAEMWAIRGWKRYKGSCKVSVARTQCVAMDMMDEFSANHALRFGDPVKVNYFPSAMALSALRIRCYCIGCYAAQRPTVIDKIS